MGYRTIYRSCPLFILAALLILASPGCGGHSQPNCAVAPGLTVIPSTATANHLAASPGNQFLFVAADAIPPGCPPTPGPIRSDLKWSVSDTTNATIGNTLNVNYGLATCINAASAPITVTATGTNIQGTTITGTGALTCN
jgi:hypothetical protein